MQNQATKIGCLIITVLGAFFILMLIVNYPYKTGQEVEVEKPDIVSGPLLELSSWNLTKEYGYVIAQGQVKNISSTRLDNVMAVITLWTKNKEFVTTADALIDYNPILPGQTSPFRVGHTDNPAITNATIDFKALMGGSIEYRDGRK